MTKKKSRQQSKVSPSQELPKRSDSLPHRTKSPLLVFVAVTGAAFLISLLVVKGPKISKFRLPGFFQSAQEKEIPVSDQSDISYVDPKDVLGSLKKGNGDHMLIVDMRMNKAFVNNHIRGTINIPFDPIAPASFVKKVAQQAHDKRVILLPYSTFSTSGEQAVEALDKKGIEAHLLTIGWNELYNLPNLWLPENEWQTFGFQDMIEHAE